MRPHLFQTLLVDVPDRELQVLDPYQPASKALYLLQDKYDESSLL